MPIPIHDSAVHFVNDNVTYARPPQPQKSSHSLVVITPAAVFPKLKTLNPTKFEGPDRIPPRVLLELQKFLYIPLTILFNNSMEKGFIPCDWKNVEITAIKKKH